jgi:type III pantothenate kinase
MNLLIDIGNTRVKWAYADDAGLLRPGELVHRGRRGILAEFVAGLTAVPDAAYAVNVAGSRMETELAAELGKRFGMGVQMLRTAARAGDVVNAYQPPEQLGADRWAAMVGAWHRFHAAVCVVDAGTAVTIDAIAADGRHQGGLIIPGLQLMLEALHRDTSDIEQFFAQGGTPPEAPDLLGLDTRSAVEKGALLSVAGAVEKVIAMLGGQGMPPRLLLTGGDAGRIAPLLPMPHEIEPQLVLDGLRRLAAGA